MTSSFQCPKVTLIFQAERRSDAVEQAACVFELEGRARFVWGYPLELPPFSQAGGGSSFEQEIRHDEPSSAQLEGDRSEWARCVAVHSGFLEQFSSSSALKCLPSLDVALRK